MKNELKSTMNKSKKTGETKSNGSVVEVWETVEIKLSRNYQSVGVAMGMKATVEKGESSVEALSRLDRKIEKALGTKVKEMSAFIDTLA